MDGNAAAETVKDIFFPKRCPVCNDAIPVERRINVRNFRNGLKGRGIPMDKGALRMLYPANICRKCISELSYIAEPYCKKCGKQLSEVLSDSEEGLCSDCRKKERAFVQSRAVLSYDEAERDIMAGLKYESKCEYAETLSLLAAERLYEWIRKISPDIIVPVPVHRDRLIRRGYNQAELIGRDISELMGIPLAADILKRTKNTRAQKELNADMRLLNLQNAFKADSEKLYEYGRKKLRQNEMAEAHRAYAQSENNRSMYSKDQDNIGAAGVRVLLIDDIYTTGSTMEACTEALLYAGAKSVYGICICAGRDAPRIDI